MYAGEANVALCMLGGKHIVVYAGKANVVLCMLEKQM